MAHRWLTDNSPITHRWITDGFYCPENFLAVLSAHSSCAALVKPHSAARSLAMRSIAMRDASGPRAMLGTARSSAARACGQLDCKSSSLLLPLLDASYLLVVPLPPPPP
eukprot:9483230-Pyramimonas_sp.AAC.1